MNAKKHIYQWSLCNHCARLNVLNLEVNVGAHVKYVQSINSLKK